MKLASVTRGFALPLYIWLAALPYLFAALAATELIPAWCRQHITAQAACLQTFSLDGGKRALA